MRHSLCDKKESGTQGQVYAKGQSDTFTTVHLQVCVCAYMCLCAYVCVCVCTSTGACVCVCVILKASLESNPGKQTTSRVTAERDVKDSMTFQNDPETVEKPTERDCFLFWYREERRGLTPGRG